MKVTCFFAAETRFLAKIKNGQYINKSFILNACYGAMLEFATLTLDREEIDGTKINMHGKCQ